MRRLLLSLVAALAVGGSAQAQLRPGGALSPRGLPPNVSIPAVTSNSVSYPGCPGEVTSHASTWYVDQVNGHTQSGGGTGAIGAPWDSLQALTGNNAGTPTSGYTQILLATAPGGNGSSPVKAGDLVIVNTGSYGAVALGASTAIVNSPALTIVAGAGQTPLLTTLATSKFTGLHIGDSLHQGLKVQSVNPGAGSALVTITDNHVPLSTSDIILEHMDISSAPVATADGWSKATWIANTRAGVAFYSVFDTTPSTIMSCVSLVNSHVYVASSPGLSVVEGESASLLVLGNEIDHFYPTAINFVGSNIAIGHNDIHDGVQTSQGYQLYAIYDSQQSDLTPANYQSNVYLYNNKLRESVDAGQTFQAAVNFYLNSCNDITNFVAWNNLSAGGGASGIAPGNSHDFVVANNSLMFSGTGQNPEINLSQGHCGTTGPRGRPPSNGWVFNNIAPIFNNANRMQTYHNIAAPGATGFANWNYFNVWTPVFVSPTPGSVITLSSVSGQQNQIDGGVGGAAPQANEFTAVPANSSFPMSPQPDWTPLAGSPAATSGGVVTLVSGTALTDFNGAAFTSPYAIGALNPPVTFTPLHTYYISTTGNDANNGLTTGTAWATPHGHTIVCGDVVLVVAASYTTQFAGTSQSGPGAWSAPTSCPSTTGGIDGTGGINFAVLLCAGSNLGSCPVNYNGAGASNAYAFELPSHWAVEGFICTATGGTGQCFWSDNGTNHTAVINNITYSSAYGVESVFSDYVAWIGNIVQQSNLYTANSSFVGGAINLNSPTNFDTVSGTHIFINGNFCTGNYGIPPTSNYAFSDLECVNLDTLTGTSYNQQIIVSDNMIYDTANEGIQINTNGGTTMTLKVDHNTVFDSYVDVPYASGGFASGEINFNQASTISTISVTNNIVRPTQTVVSGGDVFGTWFSDLLTTSVVTYTDNVAFSLFTTTGFTACYPNTSPQPYVCVNANTGHFVPGTNVYEDAAFANTSDLLSNWVGTPNCAKYINTTACMGWSFGSATSLTPIGDLTPTASGTSGLGYRTPGNCAPDANYPGYLKGIVYLHWNGTVISQYAGLVNKPCGM